MKSSQAAPSETPTTAPKRLTVHNDTSNRPKVPEALDSCVRQSSTAPLVPSLSRPAPGVAR
eukprot:887419-Alexandrium_andersonii.AAC.1